MSEQQFPIFLRKDNVEVGVFSAQSESNGSSHDETLPNQEFFGVAIDPYKDLEGVLCHPPWQHLEDDPEASVREQLNIYTLEGLDAKRRRMEEIP